MDAQLARTLRVGDTVLYRDVLHTIVEVAESDPPDVRLQGAQAPVGPVSYALVYFPVLLNPPEEE